MKIVPACFIALVIAAMTSFFVYASDTTTKFQTGPFNCSIDLGGSCNNVNIIKPNQGEKLSGRYTLYSVTACGAGIFFERYNNTTFDSNGNFKNYVKNDLLDMGADRDTIEVFERDIDSKPGAAGSGYVPKQGKKLYEVGFYVSSRTVGQIYIWENESKMISALETIHVTEAA